jgi:carotenoid cleavage dioxygenase-like enzyme
VSGAFRPAMRCCMAGVFTLPGCARGFARHSLCMLGMHCAPAPRADACTACRMDTVVKVDMTAEQDAGMVAKIELPDGLVGGEFVFVSRAPPSVAAGGAEDDGWLVGYCTDPVRMESYCLVRPRPWPAIGTIVLPTVVLGRVHACTSGRPSHACAR